MSALMQRRKVSGMGRSGGGAVLPVGYVYFQKAGTPTPAEANLSGTWELFVASGDKVWLSNDGMDHAAEAPGHTHTGSHSHSASVTNVAHTHSFTTALYSSSAASVSCSSSGSVVGCMYMPSGGYLYTASYTISGYVTAGGIAETAYVPSGTVSGSFRPNGLGFKIWIKVSYSSGTDVLPTGFISWIYPDAGGYLQANDDSRYNDLTATYDGKSPYSSQNLTSDATRAGNIGASHNHVLSAHSHLVSASHVHRCDDFYSSSIDTSVKYYSGSAARIATGYASVGTTATKGWLSGTLASSNCGTGITGDSTVGNRAKSVAVRLLQATVVIAVEFPVGSYLWEHKDHPLDFDVMEGTWVVQVFSASYFMIKNIAAGGNAELNGSVAAHSHSETFAHSHTVLIDVSHSHADVATAPTGVSLSAQTGCSSSNCGGYTGMGTVSFNGSKGETYGSATVSTATTYLSSTGDGDYDANGFRVWKRVS